MAGRAMKMILMALVAAFALTSFAEAAPPKTPRHRVTTKRSASATGTARRRAAVKRATHKRTTAKKSRTRATAKRRPTTKPR